MHMKYFSAPVFLVLLSLLFACQTETGVAKEIADKDPDFEVSSVQIVADYEASESDADHKYKDKVILVSGVISEVYRGFLYTPYVELEAGVRCNFSDNEDPVMATLSVGQVVSMKGRGDRLLFGVELRCCTVE